MITFTPDPRANSDCFSKGYEIVQKIATYYGPGPDQAWILNDSSLEVAGWYCR